MLKKLRNKIRKEDFGKMNILLTQRRWFMAYEGDNPIALLDLAPYVRMLGHNVGCYYIDEIPNKKYDVVGLSILGIWGNQVIKDALYLKNRFPDAKIVVGGKSTRSLNKDNKHLLERNGIEVWSKGGEEYFSGSQEIDFENYPSWDLRDLKSLHVESCSVMSSRGCPYSCNFCHNTEKKMSFFTAKRTVDNIELLFKLGRDFVFFVDDIFALDSKHMLRIYNECKRRGIPIGGASKFHAHINHINEKTAKVMRLFKPRVVLIGLESGDNNMLRRMGKPFTTKKAYEKIKLLAKYVNIHGLFLIGFPGETIESLNNTLKFIKKIKKFLAINVWVSYYQPVPSTIGYELAKKEGRILDTRNSMRVLSYIDKNLTKKDLIKYKELMLSTGKGLIRYKRFISRMFKSGNKQIFIREYLSRRSLDTIEKPISTKKLKG